MVSPNLFQNMKKIEINEYYYKIVLVTSKICFIIIILKWCEYFFKTPLESLCIIEYFFLVTFFGWAV